MTCSLSRTLRLWTTRALLAVFVLVGMGQSVHQSCHHCEAICENEHSCCEHRETSDEPTSHDFSHSVIKEQCPLCDFDFYKADAPSYWVYATPVGIIPTYYHFAIAQRTSWAVLDLRTNSPPLV